MEMAHNHIEDAYWFEVREASDSLVFRSNVPANPTGKVFLTRLFPNDFSALGGYLKLGFVDRPTGFWRAIGIILPTSGVLALLAMMAFGFILYALNRQKKLSDMKTDFINNMTHELKTPIATISLASEALMDPQMNAGPQQVSDFAKIIFEENSRLREQVERVLQMAAIEKGEVVLKRVTLHMHEIIQTEAARIARWVQDRGGSIELDLSATNDKISGDSVHISGIIANLLDNANKYSPKNPKIVIRTKNSPNQIAIEVIDNGVGMDRDALQKVFDKFYRVPTGNVHDVKGFGLGLSYVKSMAEVHGGKVSVTSELGKGSVFILTLPTKS
jgi:signal transduction histidine kinase